MGNQCQGQCVSGSQRGTEERGAWAAAPVGPMRWFQSQRALRQGPALLPFGG